jgi:galactoside O-acetyltransferase
MAKAEQYYTASELAALGLGSCGRHVFISRHASIGSPERIHIGNMVRIDAFTTLIGAETVVVGDHVHIGSSVTINAAAPVTIGDYAGISAGVRLFTTDDDYSGGALTGPTVSSELTNIRTEPVALGQHCVVGANSVILPGVVLEEGVVVGALSLVKDRLEAWGIYAGVPARMIRRRSKDLLEKLPIELTVSSG